MIAYSKISKFTLICFFSVIFFASYSSFGQQMTNEKYNRIIVTEGPQKGWLEIFVDPTGFECECKDVPSVVFKPISRKGCFQSEDKTVVLQIKDDTYIFSVKENKDCCFLKAGTYR